MGVTVYRHALPLFRRASPLRLPLKQKTPALWPGSLVCCALLRQLSQHGINRIGVVIHCQRFVKHINQAASQTADSRPSSQASPDFTNSAAFTWVIPIIIPSLR